MKNTRIPYKFSCYPHFLPTMVPHYNDCDRACEVMRNITIRFTTPSDWQNCQLHIATNKSFMPPCNFLLVFKHGLTQLHTIMITLSLQDKDSRHSVPPIDVLWIKGRLGGDYFYSFGGCHRYEAYKRLNKKTIPCKLIHSTVENLKVYLGSSVPDLK